MKKLSLIFIGILLLAAFTLPGCVAKDPVHPIVIQAVRDGLQEEFGEELANVEKIIIFEYMMKIYMAPGWPNDNLGPFARKATFLFGTSMRTNKKRNVSYFLNVYQDKEIEGKMHRNKQIAECIMENATDRIDVKLLGLGSGKYDVK